MCQVALFWLFFINMVIDINSFFSKITTKLLDELTRHARSNKMGCKPMTAAIRAEVILQLIRV